MCYVTKLPSFGSENPHLGASKLKLKQEVFQFFLLIFYLFGLTDFSTWLF